MRKKQFHLVNYHTDQIIFDGWFQSFAHCVEQAIVEGVCLDGVNMSGQDLSCGNMDDAHMSGAYCKGANFAGANLSEGVFDNIDFASCDLTNVCFAVSSLMDVDFMNSSFHGCDVTDAVVRHCRFSCPSMFTVQWQRAAIFSDCAFMDDEFGLIRMNKPPVLIQGLPQTIVILDDVVRVGAHYILKSDIQNAGMAHLKYLYGTEVASYLYPVLRSKECKIGTKNTLQDGMSVL